MNSRHLIDPAAGPEYREGFADAVDLIEQVLRDHKTWDDKPDKVSIAYADLIQKEFGQRG